MDSLGRQQRTPSGRGHKWTAATTDVDGSDGGRYGEAAAAVMNGGDRCGRRGAFMPGLVGPFRRRRHLPADLCIDVATAASGAERRMYCMVPADDLFHRVMFFGSCPSAKNGRGDKDMATTDVGQTGQYGDTGRWAPSYSIEQSTYVLFPFVLCILYLVADACYVCSCAHLYRTCMHVVCVSA